MVTQSVVKSVEIDQFLSQQKNVHRNLFPADLFFAETLLRHEDWAVPIPHAGSAGQERVFVAHIGIRVNADRGNIEFTPKGAFVKCLDVLEYVLELEIISRYQTFCQPVKHERIVRVRRVAERKSTWHHGRSFCPAFHQKVMSFGRRAINPLLTRYPGQFPKGLRPPAGLQGTSYPGTF